MGPQAQTQPVQQSQDQTEALAIKEAIVTDPSLAEVSVSRESLAAATVTTEVKSGPGSSRMGEIVSHAVTRRLTESGVAPEEALRVAEIAEHYARGLESEISTVSDPEAEEPTTHLEAIRAQELSEDDIAALEGAIAAIGGEEEFDSCIAETIGSARRMIERQVEADMRILRMSVDEFRASMIPPEVSEPLSLGGSPASIAAVRRLDALFGPDPSFEVMREGSYAQLQGYSAPGSGQGADAELQGTPAQIAVGSIFGSLFGGTIPPEMRDAFDEMQNILEVYMPADAVYYGSPGASEGAAAADVAGDTLQEHVEELSLHKS